jgi:hypothetical protein
MLFEQRLEKEQLSEEVTLGDGLGDAGSELLEVAAGGIR